MSSIVQKMYSFFCFVLKYPEGSIKIVLEKIKNALKCPWLSWNGEIFLSGYHGVVNKLYIYVGLSIGSLLIQINRSSRLCNTGVQGCSCDGLIRACSFRWWKTSSRENKRMDQKEERKWLLPTRSAKRHLQDVLPR